MSLLELLTGTIAASLLASILIGFWQHQLADTAAWSQTSAVLRLMQRHNRRTQCDPVGTVYAVADLEQAASYTTIEQPQKWRINRISRHHLSVESQDASTPVGSPDHTSANALLVYAVSGLSPVRQFFLHTQGSC